MLTEAAAEEERGISTTASLSLPPPHVLRHLHSIGVCIQCIFRLFGIKGNANSSSSITPSTLLLLLEAHKNCENGDDPRAIHGLNGLVRCSYASENSETGQKSCSICLGILQFELYCDPDKKTVDENSSISDFTEALIKAIRSESHQIDGFTLEVSVPPVIVANDRAMRLYLKRKYGSEDWYKEESLSAAVPVKDFLRLSITSSLQNQLGTKSALDSFHIRVKYTHSEASRRLQNSLANDLTCIRRKSVSVIENNGGSIGGESDAAVYKALNSMSDQVFCEHFVLPPEKMSKACELLTTCYRMPIFISGRYLKFSRKVSQSRWIIDDERMGETSVEEIIGNNTLAVVRGDSYKFHAAGREDIDVRMLGSGRPFLVEVLNARCIPSEVHVHEIMDNINNLDDKYVMVRDLKVVGSEVWNLMREGESEKQKQYTALVWISRPLTEDDIQALSSATNLDVLQRTPARVLHRRSPMERNKIIHWMKIERITDCCQFFLLHLCTQAGTYIKEFVHGDLGRTNPSIGSILGCRAEILQLDVTDIKMDVLN